MSDLSKRLREICDRHDAIGNIPMITTDDLRRYADIIDQQAAEIERLTEAVEILQQDCFNLSEKVLPNVRAERDEWRRRAWWLWDRLIITLDDDNDVAAEVYPEAAQWFEES